MSQAFFYSPSQLSKTSVSVTDSILRKSTYFSDGFLTWFNNMFSHLLNVSRKVEILGKVANIQPGYKHLYLALK